MRLRHANLLVALAVVLSAGNAPAQHLSGEIDYWDTRPLRPYGCAVVGNTPWFTTNDGVVFTINPLDGSTTPYDSLLDPVFFGQVIAAPDGTLWIADGEDRLVQFIPATGTFVPHAVPHPQFNDPAGPNGVAIAADGAVWCTMADDRSLGRYDPVANSWQRFPVTPPPEGIDPLAHLTFGPGGNVWFTIRREANNAPGMGRYDPVGNSWQTWVNPYPGAFSPFGIIFDHGVVWFVDHHGSKLVRFTPPAGPFMAWDTPNVPAFVDDPHFLVPDPDGVLFITGFGTSHLFAFDPATATFESRALVFGAQPMGIARAESGYIWWAQTGAQGTDPPYEGAGVGRFKPSKRLGTAPALTGWALALAAALLIAAGCAGLRRRRA